ncbi:replication-relaxation family protein [Tengunoibacter tsumagoiensis]|uniref:Uncharacterized protein n=1 Tax=Tengunoibacter tsumagoiensis TaxID=2014871 RepID=A0A402A7G3_9CHLR|nr:replication-relaxation family protein [Tengunoibacter tsumagoiensis]GCE15058.1 hypothetical protein KTT_49170 [Tengunoibacter tsumagoiensis]
MTSDIALEYASTIWTPFYRKDLEAFLKKQEYTPLHLSVLSWLIWFSLLSHEELLRVLVHPEQPQIHASNLSAQLKKMSSLGLIETIRLREPSCGIQKRYYVTDLGLYLYSSAIHSSPPLSIARLAQSYYVERDDLLARLAHPHIHLACVSLATRIIAEGPSRGHRLISYQQPWQHTYTFAHKRHLLSSHAAFLLETQEPGGAYAFLIHVDSEVHQKAEREIEKWLLSLLDLRQSMKLYRHHWPDLFIISTRNRIPLWARLQEEVSLKRNTPPLSGGITTFDALSRGVYANIWWELDTLASSDDYRQISLAHLLRQPASLDLVEQFSHQRHFYEMLLKDAVAPPPRTKQRLTRYVGDSLQDEATHLSRERLNELFFPTRKNRQSVAGAGLLTLKLTVAEKEIIEWAAHHPLLDVPTFQTLTRPAADPQAMKPLQHHITHLFQLGLLEARIWSQGSTPLEQQRYLLTSTALKFMAYRKDEPYSYYFIPPKYQKGDDEQLDRQWGTRGLSGQMWHTHALYSFMRQLYQSAHIRGEMIYQWKSAHEAARWYRDTITQDDEHTRPDAELIFALSPTDQPIRMVLLEYDRGTTGIVQYSRKFTAYLDYQQATGSVLPLLVVTSSHKATERMQQVLNTLQGSLHILLLLEKEILSEGLSLVVRLFSP